MKVQTGKAGLGSNRLILALMALLVLAVGAFITILVITGTQGGYDKEYIRHAGELRVLSQEIAKNANEAASGRLEAFGGLRQSTNEFVERWRYLNDGDTNQGLPASPALVAPALQAVQSTWDRVQVNAEQILASQKAVLALHEVADSLSQSIPQLQAEYDDVIALLLADRTSADQIAIAQRQSWLAERIVSNVNKILEGGDDAVLAADAFELDSTEFSRVFDAMLNGDSTLNVDRVRNQRVLDIFGNITGQFQIVRDSADQIIQTSPELFQVREAADTIYSDSIELLDRSSQLTERYENLPFERNISPYYGYACGILALAIIGLLGLVIFRDTQQRLVAEESTNQQKETAIMQLLDEIADLADGDLTATATVTEEHTGAIADAINFAVEQLRSLVISINENSELVAKAAEKTQSTASLLTEASSNQSDEIKRATGSINEIAHSMDDVSGRAGESAKVAERSVVIANKGTEAVQNTIHGMDKIREQIQKTSKQIKRLGESSQEIGDIISLINDIADQTNILSLNAAIQASMAGDAGRGFAVVADEVQRLAERSAAATKQIEILVKTIQADTNEAVISMEQTTAEVVQGARLAQDAGVALEEIEEVSNDLSELIQEISTASGQQSESANHITKTMSIIQEITSQTYSGTQATSASVGNLAVMAREMRNSVAGFTLPGVSTGMVSPTSRHEVSTIHSNNDAEPESEELSTEESGNSATKEFKHSDSERVSSPVDHAVEEIDSPESTIANDELIAEIDTDIELEIELEMDESPEDDDKDDRQASVA